MWQGTVSTWCTKQVLSGQFPLEVVGFWRPVDGKQEAQFIVTDWGDKVEHGIRFSYQPDWFSRYFWHMGNITRVELCLIFLDNFNEAYRYKV